MHKILALQRSLREGNNNDEPSTNNRVPKRYYGHFTSEPTLFNPFDEAPGKDIVFLYSCTRDGCDRVETKSGTFIHCPKCMTRYCSQSCMDEDTSHGQHKVKCIRFGVVKAKMENTLCRSCWKRRWEEIQTPPKGRPYILCHKCTKKETKLESELMTKLPIVVSDPEIIRVWFH